MKFARWRVYARNLGAGLGVLGLMGLAEGCATPSKSVAAVTSTLPAQITLANASDYAWKIVARPQTGGSPIERYVSARASVELTLPPQTYTVEQTMLLRADVASTSRQFSFTPESGQSYRWHLGTLLSEPAGDLGTGSDHE